MLLPGPGFKFEEGLAGLWRSLGAMESGRERSPGIMEDLLPACLIDTARIPVGSGIVKGLE